MTKTYSGMNPDMEKIYLDWVNNYITTDKFAEHYRINRKDANELIAILRRNHLETSYEKGQA